ncbi:YicC family protein [Aestuariivirga litoralis]|uniref:YicC family protein n=1 Tax=Aestuariivirga litoralis TaxID=2650924 RepID=A0A2W2APA8_9HYPH|nr:YicC/YloC family endoribonuclease [Aestuariivirga litoralis]PZF77231.1 YicC family protein [Aestuariivirga litoralis]
MPISSMTGFARASGERQGLFWQWEIKSVNGKALDVRLKMPPGFEALEVPVRAALASAFRRGNLQVSLSVSGQMGRETVRLNQDILDRLVAAGETLRDRIGGEPLRADVLLSIKGVVEVTTEPEEEAEIEARNAAMLASFHETLTSLAAARREEGDRLNAVISAQVLRIAELAEAAKYNPARTPEAIRARLAEQVARLMETGSTLDPDRLHQEAVLAATRADIQEELDRLASHVEAARVLLASNEAVGRKFDFLAQEFNREANTLCSKASDRSLTAIGLDLKTVIDQLREQVQNIE